MNRQKEKEKYQLLFSKIFWMMKAIKMMTIIIIQIVKKRNIMMMMRRRRKRRRSTLCYIERPNDDEPNLPNIINSINSNYSFIWIILWILQLMMQAKPKY